MSSLVKKGPPATMYRVRFVNREELWEVYARRVVQGELYGFVTLEELVFDTHAGVVVDPHEERLKREFAGVTRTMVPMHAVVRIDEVEKRGPGRITSLPGGAGGQGSAGGAGGTGGAPRGDSNVSRFPSHPPGRRGED